MATLGRSGIDCSRVIMGTWQAGGEYWVGVDDAESVRAIHAALAAGINGFDTAAEYGDGRSERILGQALAGRREAAMLCSKVFADNLRPDRLIASCERSLRNLNTDYLDLFLIHWPSGSFGSEPVPLADSLAAMTRLREQGKVHALGVSNFDAAQLRQTLALTRIEAVQNPYNLFWRYSEAEVLPLCREQGLTLMAYSPLAQGILAERFATTPSFAPGDHRHANKLFLRWPQVLAALEGLQGLAASHQVPLPQLALATLLADENVHVVAGARTAAQAQANATAQSLTLPQAAIDSARRLTAEVAAHFAHDPMPWDW